MEGGRRDKNEKCYDAFKIMILTKSQFFLQSVEFEWVTFAVFQDYANNHKYSIHLTFLRIFKLEQPRFDSYSQLTAKKKMSFLMPCSASLPI